MGSPPTIVLRMKTSRQWEKENLPLGIYIFMFCLVVGCLCVGFYELMQPQRFPNPGIASYRPPTSSGNEIRSTAGVGGDPLIGSDLQVTNSVATPRADAKSGNQSKAASAKRHHPAVLRRPHDPTAAFASAPLFGQPWRPWRGTTEGRPSYPPPQAGPRWR